MRTFLVLLGVLGGISLSGAAYAGFGAISYSASTGEIGYSYGWDNYGDAVNEAQAQCMYADCTLINWEENSCNAFATEDDGDVWGESHGYGDSGDAINAAVDACGAGCSWQVWICN